MPDLLLRALALRIIKVFKPWIVRRPEGQCQILFALTELDGIVDAIVDEVRGAIEEGPK